MEMNQAVRCKLEPRSHVNDSTVMRRSNRNYNSPPSPPPPPSRANPSHLTIFCAREVENLTGKAFPGMGNLTGKAFLGVGNLTFAWVGWGKLKCQVSNGFSFFRAPKSLTAINTCLD